MGGSYLRKQWSTAIQQPGLGFGDFKPCLIQSWSSCSEFQTLLSGSNRKWSSSHPNETQTPFLVWLRVWIQEALDGQFIGRSEVSLLNSEEIKVWIMEASHDTSASITKCEWKHCWNKFHCLKCCPENFLKSEVFSNASPVRTVHFLGVMIGVFESGSKEVTNVITSQMSALHSPTSFLFSHLEFMHHFSALLFASLLLSCEAFASYFRSKSRRDGASKRISVRPFTTNAAETVLVGQLSTCRIIVVSVSCLEGGRRRKVWDRRELLRHEEEGGGTVDDEERRGSDVVRVRADRVRFCSRRSRQVELTYFIWSSCWTMDRKMENVLACQRNISMWMDGSWLRLSEKASVHLLEPTVDPGDRFQDTFWLPVPILNPNFNWP
jgi:hypothetical protein